MITTLALLFSLSNSPSLAESPTALNALGLRLQREGARSQPGQNIVTSPVALYQALGMTANGAGGETHETLTRLLGNTASSIEDVNRLNTHCLDQLTSPRSNASSGPVIRLANAAWDSRIATRHPLTFSEGYLRRLRQSYRAHLGSLDFSQPRAAADINAWANEQTFGLLTRVVDPPELRNLIFLLMNTTYFEGSWAVPFRLIEPGGRLDEYTKFASAPGQERHVPVISKRAHFRYLRGAHEEVVEIPFVSPHGRDVVFYAVLPERGRADFTRVWDEAFWSTLLASMRSLRPEEGLVTLPKFAFDFGVDMKAGEALTRAMGLDFLFQRSANFDPIATAGSPAAMVGLIKEVSRIELDEKGVKAAAAAIVGGIMKMGISPPAKFDVRFDRPFAFAIAEKQSGLFLFTGELHDPN